MAHVLHDRVKETSLTTGTGALTLSGAADGGFRTFASVMATGDTTTITIAHQTVEEWEVCVATRQANGTLVRGAPLASSNGGAAVNFSGGEKDVFITLPAARVGGSYSVGPSPPSSPRAGDVWLDDTTGALYTYIVGSNAAQWVELAGTGRKSWGNATQPDPVLMSLIYGD
jgi:hypothetical protein